VSQQLAEQLHRVVIVENKAGAGGSVGAGVVAGAKPDGATLLMANAGIQAINPSLYKKLPYDAVNGFAPISRVGNVTNVLIVNSTLPVRTVGELIAYAKANPGKVQFGSAGNGTTMHLTGEMFQRRAGVQMTHVPYRGSGPAMTDLIAGHISVIFENLPTALPFIQSGKVKAIAVTSSTRAQALPDLPTIAESGLPGFDATSWFGLLLPAKASADKVAELHSAIAGIVSSPPVQRQLLESGVEPYADKSPQDFKAFIEQESRKWGQLVKDANVKLE
jgi:tripartite-type tricarboxylate transporter receptor subunit TctC